jgi:hypothetical protein
VKKFALKAWHGFTAAVTSPTAVAQEKSLAVFITVRVLIAVGASDALVRLIEQLA